MPRSLQEIIDNADALADAFEAMGEDGTEVEVVDAAPLRRVLAAARARQQAEQEVLDAVRAARQASLPWLLIGSYLGTSGEAARQRYGGLVEAVPQRPDRTAKKAVPTAKKATAQKRTDKSAVTGQFVQPRKRAGARLTAAKQDPASSKGRRSG